MALIKCPECGKDISSLSEKCINCGFPLKDMHKSGVCVIGGKSHDLSLIRDRLLAADLGNKEETNAIVWDLYHAVGSISIYAASALAKEILNTKSVPASYDGSHLTVRSKTDDGRLHCPRCDSTNVVTGQRGYSMVWGFVGSNRTMNRCGKCGYKWEPKK